MERACENCSQKANPCWGTSEERHTCQFHTWKEAPLLEALDAAHEEIRLSRESEGRVFADLLATREALAKARAALEAAGIEVEL